MLYNKKILTITFFYVVFITNINNIVYANLPSATEKPSTLKKLELQRQMFLEVENFLKKNNNFKESKSIINKILPHLHDYPLYPYLEGMLLQKFIQHIDFEEMKSFVELYPETPLIKTIKDSWLLHQAKQKNWHHFIKGYNTYANHDNIELTCYFIQANYKLNYPSSAIIENFNEEIKNIWLNSNQHPNACNLVFENWKKSGLMTRAMIWQKIKLAIHSNKFTFARHLSSNYLPKQENETVELWIKVHQNPNLITQKYYFSKHNHPVVTEILMHGITNIAKKDPEKAIKIWGSLSNYAINTNSNYEANLYKFTYRHHNNIIKSIAIALAKNSNANAWEWLNKISPEYKDQEVYNLQLTLALKNREWNKIISLYDNLPNNFKQQEKWLYWYARSLEHQGRTIESKRVLIELANNRSYYGFLSSSKLLKPYNFKFKPIEISNQQISLVLKNKSVQRAYELLHLDRINKANLEWNHAVKNMPEWELHAAAKLADNLSMPNWAIIALSDAKQKDDLSLRFPQYYSNYIVNEANKNQLDPAWVFAVTRQESAFRPNVKSYAGALGLMQVMPKTGFMVARTMNMNLKNHKDILDINNNIKLGSKYLQLMLEQYKNLVVATAAYNAGPGRIQKWLPNYETAADLWIETIPFKDTREYVQNVMTYTIIYQKLLGKHHYLNMPLIKKI